MEVVCDEHNVALADGRCLSCLEAFNEGWRKWSEEHGGATVTTGWPPLVTKGYVRVDGKRVRYFHSTDWLERGDIPEELMEEINSYIDKRVSEFNCNCYRCQLDKREIALV